ncbi:MAG: PH domain-containing protein [Nocardioides sp.]|nr:PH domain-containing protein [Nocardioides sp.]
MSFPQRLLNDGEHVVVSTRTHVKAVFVPVLLALVVLALAALGTWLADRLEDAGTERIVVVVLWVLAAAALVWWFLRPLVAWLTTTYTFTNRRFIKRTGFIARQGRTIPLNRISGVDFEIGVVDRVFRCGTLVVSDASENGSVELHDIPQVERVQMRVAEELHRLSEGGRDDDGT